MRDNAECDRRPGHLRGRDAPRRLHGDISDAFAQSRQEPGAFVWIGLFEPDEAEFDLVKQELGLHPLAAEDAVSAHQRPKLERYGDTLFIVLKTLTYIDETSDIEVGEIMLFLGQDFVVTVRHGSGNPLGPVRERLEQAPELLKHGPAAVLYAVCDEVVDRYESRRHEVEVDIIGLERARVRPDRAGRDRRHLLAQAGGAGVPRRGGPLIPVMHEIVKGRVRDAGGTREYFRDVLDHLMRVDEQVDAHNELLTTCSHAHLAPLGKQQNEDMRKISAWAAIIAVPTVIAGSTA